MLRLTTAVLVSCAFLHAQTAPCFGVNDQNPGNAPGTTAFSFAGPTSWGYQFVTPGPLVARAATIFTTNAFQDYAMSLELWSEDPATRLPGRRLATGTCLVARPLGLAWQGVDLDADVALAAGTPYWFVWIEPGGMDLPYEPGGTALPAARISGGAWSAQTPREIKFRLYCDLLDGQNVAPVGDGCASSSGSVGRLFTNHPPTLGNLDFQLEGSGFPAAAATLLLLGVQANFPSLPVGGTNGCFLHTDALAILPGTTGTGSLRGTTPRGHVAYLLPVPGVGVAGALVGAQLLVFDAGSAFPLPAVSSNGLRLVVY